MKAIGSLKMNKAAGPDNIYPEHLVYGSHLILVLLALLFNSIIVSGHSHIPPAFRHGLIPNSSTKDLTNPSSILSNLSKELERFVSLIIFQQDPPPTLNPLQRGFHAGYSCSQTALVLQVPYSLSVSVVRRHSLPISI